MIGGTSTGKLLELARARNGAPRVCIRTINLISKDIRCTDVVCFLECRYFSSFLTKRIFFFFFFACCRDCSPDAQCVAQIFFKFLLLREISRYAKGAKGLQGPVTLLTNKSHLICVPFLTFRESLFIQLPTPADPPWFIASWSNAQGVKQSSTHAEGKKDRKRFFFRNQGISFQIEWKYLRFFSKPRVFLDIFSLPPRGYLFFIFL